MGEAKRRRDAEAAEQMPFVPPEDWRPMPGGALAMAVIFGDATLRAGLPREAVAAVKKVKVSAKEPQAVKNEIMHGMMQNKHLLAEDALRMLTGALMLVLTGEAGEIMQMMADKPGMTFTYHITPLDQPDSYNWRLITAPG